MRCTKVLQAYFRTVCFRGVRNRWDSYMHGCHSLIVLQQGKLSAHAMDCGVRLAIMETFTRPCPLPMRQSILLALAEIRE